MNSITNFFKQLTARLKGDEAALIVAKNERKANSAINGQLAALKAKLVDDESNVEDKQEAYKNALYPTYYISDNQAYVKSIVNANEWLENAQSTLESTKMSIAFFENILESEFKAVEVATTTAG